MSAAPIAPERLRRTGTNAILLAGVALFLLQYLDPAFLFSPTTATGGDTPGHVHAAHHLAEVLLPSGRLIGWDMGHFAGFPLFQFYFPLPFLLAVALGQVMPLAVAFKLITVLGPLTLPVATFYAFRALGYQFPVPVVAASLSLPFLLQEGNSMWGGNLSSTLAGEFCHSIGLSLAVVFIGSLARGLETGKRVFWNGLLLAACGLSHTYAFFFALPAALALVLEKPPLGARAKNLAAVLAVAFFLHAFWAIPLVEKIGWTTAWVYLWEIRSLSEVVPAVLLPLLVLAGAAAVLARFGARMRPGSHAGVFLLVLVAHAVFYTAAPALGLVDIRFVPGAQFVICFLAADLVALACRLVRFRATVAAVVFAATVLWTGAHVRNAPHWVKWNYEGFEGKAAWPVLRDIHTFLAGDYGDPRVAFEFSPRANRFGSVRAFEALPHFAGRQVLEGTLLHSALNAPFIYYLQSEISETGTAPIPGYVYPRFDLERATAHLRLFNVEDVIAVSDTAVSALAASPRFDQVYARGEYRVFRLRERGQYVTVPRFQPVLFETDDWRKAFHAWYRRPELLEIPLVATDLVPRPEQGRFPLRADDLSRLPRQPVGERCEVEETIGHDSIRFRTNCVGLPHLVRVSYFPNWSATGARRVYPVSPAFMLVFPEEREVRLEYGSTPGDVLGRLLSGGAFAIALIGWAAGALVRRRGGWPAALRRTLDPAVGLARGAGDRLFAALEARRRLVPVILTASAVALTGAGLWARYEKSRPGRWFRAGFTAQQAGDFGRALEYFERLIEKEEESYLRQSAQLHAGWSYLQLDEPGAAARAYEDLIAASPDSAMQVEASYHLATALHRLGETERAIETFRRVARDPSAGRWAGFARDRLRELGALAEPEPAEVPGADR